MEMDARISPVVNVHSLAVTVACVGFSIMLCVGLTTTIAVSAVVCLLGVVLIGLPHGAMDHCIGKDVLSRFGVPWPATAFFAAYLLGCCLVLAGWYVAPLVTVVAFFILSAWHFGLEEEDGGNRFSMSLAGVIAFAAMIARGGIVIWVPCVFQAEQVTYLLTSTIPVESISYVESLVRVIVGCWPIWAALVIYDCLSYRSARKNVHARAMGVHVQRIDIQHAGRVASMCLMFSLANPLIAFFVYFCCWHSVRGLAELCREFGGDSRFYLKQCLPVFTAAIGLFLIGLVVYSLNIGLTEGAIRTTFIGLSAVAIPHLFLHVIAKVALDESLEESMSLSKGVT